MIPLTQEQLNIFAEFRLCGLSLFSTLGKTNFAIDLLDYGNCIQHTRVHETYPRV